MKIYGIGGLGADQRVFANLRLKADFIFIEWIKPCNEESLKAYAHRLIEQIDLTEEFHLIGVSFGGIIAQEINSIIKPKSVILISSVLNRTEIPFMLRIIGQLGLFRLVPLFSLKPPKAISSWAFGVKSEDNKTLLASIMRDTDPSFLRWAIQNLATWKHSKIIKGNIIRFHGDSDRLLKNKTLTTSIIHNAGHFMILEEGGLLSEKINEILDQKSSITP